MKVRARKTLFVLIVVGLLTWGAGCYSTTSGDGDETFDGGGGKDTAIGSDSDSDSDSDGDGDADSDTDVDTDVDADTDTDTETETETDTETDSGEDTDSITGGDTDTKTDTCWDGGWYCEEGGAVESPAPGTPANRAPICATATPLVTSNEGATVSLNVYSASPHLATGAIEIAPGLRGFVVGEPIIVVTEASDAVLETLDVSDITTSATGFTFNAAWPASFTGGGSMVVKVTFVIDCDVDGGGAEATVEATTNFEWCHDEGYDAPASEGWVGSGNVCYWCDCWNGEMAPTPIPLDTRADGLALPRSFGVEIQRVAELDGEVVLLAEHPEARGAVEYAWEVSGGSLLDSDQGGVVWRLSGEPGPHLVQVAVRDADSAAVAAMRVDP